MSVCLNPELPGCSFPLAEGSNNLNEAVAAWQRQILQSEKEISRLDEEIRKMVGKRERMKEQLASKRTTSTRMLGKSNKRAEELLTALYQTVHPKINKKKEKKKKTLSKVPKREMAKATARYEPFSIGPTFPASGCRKCRVHGIIRKPHNNRSWPAADNCPFDECKCLQCGLIKNERKAAQQRNITRKIKRRETKKARIEADAETQEMLKKIQQIIKNCASEA